ncbi:MAG: methionine synthase [Streptosporangiaceae bacterium]
MSQPVPFPWPAQSATGVGSMPGTDVAEALAVVLGELSDLPFLPELPGRGPGADMIGRTAAVLVDLPVETTPTGWRLAERRGRDLGRAAGLLESDLDALEDAAAGYSGAFKIQLSGPWTLAASLALTHSMEPALSDAGAVADLAASLAEGAAAHAADIRRRVPGAKLVMQYDEPALPGVLAGSVPTASGLRRVSAVDDPVAADHLGPVLAATQAPTVVHCCAADVPWSLIASAGARAVSFDLALVRRTDEDAIGEIAEAGLGIVIGAVPATEGAGRLATGPMADNGRPAGNGRPMSAQDFGTSVIRLWDRIGLPLAGLTSQVVVTPACGLAGVSPARARAVLAQCQEAARLIPEMIEEGVR